MALVASTLVSALQRLCDPTSASFAGYPATLAAAQAAFASAYDSYAKTAVDLGGNLMMGGNVSGFQSSLAFVQAGTAAAAAANFDAAFCAYWASVAFGPTPLSPPTRGVGGTGIFLTALASKVIPPVPGPLTASLVPLLSATPPTTASAGAAQAAALANALAAATAAVMVVVSGLDTTPPPPPGAGPLPIVATGTIK